jgi:uncharacterized protein (DUF58 family)
VVAFGIIGVQWLLAQRRSGRAQHITGQGVSFFLLTLAVGIIALHTKINFLVLIFGMMLSTSVLSVLLSRTAMRGVQFARRVPGSVYPDQPFAVELEATNGKRLLSSYGLTVEDKLPEGLDAPAPGGVVLQLRPRASVVLPYTVTARRRGVYPLTTVRYATRFPFGFFHQERSRPLASEVVAYPRLGTVAANLLGRAQALALTRHHTQTARGDEEFRSLREYRTGDNPRWIHWKTSAKLGKPLVREHEAVVTERAFLLLDTRAPAGGTEPLESAVSFAASLARDLMLRHFHVALAAYAPDLLVTTAMKGPAALHELLDLLARLQPAPGRSRAELVNEPQVRAEARTLVVAVLLRRDADADAALELLAARHPRVLPVDASAPEFANVFALARPASAAEKRMEPPMNTDKTGRQGGREAAKKTGKEREPQMHADERR